MKNLIILPDITIKHALKKLSQTGEKCLVVADQNNTLLGTLSDGDLRKAILKGAGVGGSIVDIYQPKPTVLVRDKYKLEQAKELFIKYKFDLIPIVDEKGKVIDVLVWEEVFKNGEKKQRTYLDAPVVIMAGGKGTRLEPFTKVLPKPLVPIHEKPVIEHIIEKFTAVGVREFYLTVNYKSRILKAFFEELNPDYSVSFVEEPKPLGTAGSLEFLEGKFDKPFLVTNCDIIIDADYSDLYAFHRKKEYDITLVASIKNYIIPYGTCELNSDGHLNHIKEKPEYNFLVNTGLYILNQEVLELIPKGKVYHMNNLIEDAKNHGMKVGVYPINEDLWIDVGQWAEYKKAIEKL